jgi:hypothetical protein
LREEFSGLFWNGAVDWHFLVDDPVDAGPGDAVGLGDLSETLSMLAICQDGVASGAGARRPMGRPSRRARRIPADTIERTVMMLIEGHNEFGDTDRRLVFDRQP